jgi:hypothetical protein
MAHNHKAHKAMVEVQPHLPMGAFLGIVVLALVAAGAYTNWWIQISGKDIDPLLCPNGDWGAYLFKLCKKDCTYSDTCDDIDDSLISDKVKNAQAWSNLAFIAAVVGAIGHALGAWKGSLFKFIGAAAWICVVAFGIIATSSFVTDDNVKDLIDGNTIAGDWDYGYSFKLFVAGWVLAVVPAGMAFAL